MPHTPPINKKPPPLTLTPPPKPKPKAEVRPDTPKPADASKSFFQGKELRSISAPPDLSPVKESLTPKTPPPTQVEEQQAKQDILDVAEAWCQLFI